MAKKPVDPLAHKQKLDDRVKKLREELTKLSQQQKQFDQRRAQGVIAKYAIKYSLVDLTDAVIENEFAAIQKKYAGQSPPTSTQHPSKKNA